MKTIRNKFLYRLKYRRALVAKQFRDCLAC